MKSFEDMVLEGGHTEEEVTAALARRNREIERAIGRLEAGDYELVPDEEDD